MVVFSCLLYRWLFTGGGASLHLMLLVGIVFGTLFRGLSSLLQRLIDPSEFIILQDLFFASFNSVDGLLWPSPRWPLRRRIGGWRCAGTGWTCWRWAGTPRSTWAWTTAGAVTTVLMCVAVLVAVSTALVGPDHLLRAAGGQPGLPALPRTSATLLLPIAALLGVDRAGRRPTGARADVRLRHRAEHRHRIRGRPAVHRPAAERLRQDDRYLGRLQDLRRRRPWWTMSAATFRAAASPPSSAPTGPASRRCCRWSAGCCRWMPGPSASTAWTWQRPRARNWPASMAILRQENQLTVRLTVRDLVGFGRFPHYNGRPTANDQGPHRARPWSIWT